MTMLFFKRYLPFLLLFFSCTCCFSQSNNPLKGQAILVKITEQKDTGFINTLCNNSNSRWNKISKHFTFIAVKRASLLSNDKRMGRWLEITFAPDKDSLQLVNTLKQLPFIACVQNVPGQLLPCSSSSDTLVSSTGALPWYLEQTHIPALWKLTKKRNIKVAVIDDGIRLTHKDIAGRIWTNPNEIAGNNKDDDGDGFIDDIHGWDVSDDDNDVSPPENRLQDFYHGTHIAGIIALATPRMADDKFGIYIIPVKCLSDNAKLTYLKDGYKGIEYAIKAGADIINCSWGGGEFSQYEKDLLQAAADKNILIIASAGNYPTEQIQYPAGGKNVIAITGLDSNNIKPHNFNYGSFIGLSAPGVNILGASVMDDSSRTVSTGTSEATPIVTSIAALLMACYPELKAKDVEMILKNCATPVDELNAEYAGKLGAGLVDASKAIQLLSQGLPTNNPEVTTNAKGYLLFNKNNSAKTKQQAWFIHPYGHYRGIRVYMPPSFSKSKGSISLYKTSVTDSNLINSYSLQQLPDSSFMAQDSLWVVLKADKLQKDFNLSISYTAETVDSSCLYCSGTKVFTASSGTFSDGSKENNYAGRESCKWLIQAPPGKKITLEFTAFDTEPRVDFVYVFDGDQTNGKILALYSGPNIPPPVISRHNKMLVWFVTSETVHGKGWDAKYSIQ